MGNPHSALGPGREGGYPLQSWLVLAVFCLDTNNKMPHVAREGTTEQTTLTYSELLVMVISKTLPLLDSSVP